MPIDPGLRRLALRTMVAAFAGKSMPEWAGALLTDGLAGYTVFGTNITDGDQLAALTAQLRAVRPDALIAIDEEGGDVTRLGHRPGSPYPGNAALGAIDDPDLTRSVYAAIGADLTHAGITLDFAPAVDVTSADDNTVIGTRSFGADPQHVALHAAAAVTGLQSTGVAACAKHFPGHGATTTDSHLALPTIDVPDQVLRERDLPPFAAAIAAGVKAVMTAHIRVPHLTGTAPATFSRAALQGLLRDQYGFRGVIATDALEMTGAVAAAGGMGTAAVLALTAGADLLCLGARIDHDLVEHVAAAIVTAVRDKQLTTTRLEEAAARNAELAAWTRRPHTLPLPDPTLGYAAARSALRVEGSPAGFSNPLVVQLEYGHTISEGRVPWGLGPHLYGQEQVTAVPVDASPEELITRAGARPIVVVGRRIYRLEATRVLIERLAAGHTVAVVEMGWPSTWRPAGVRAFVTTYGASHASGRAVAEALGLTH